MDKGATKYKYAEDKCKKFKASAFILLKNAKHEIPRAIAREVLSSPNLIIDFEKMGKFVDEENKIGKTVGYPAVPFIFDKFVVPLDCTLEREGDPFLLFKKTSECGSIYEVFDILRGKEEWDFNFYHVDLNQRSNCYIVNKNGKIFDLSKRQIENIRYSYSLLSFISRSYFFEDKNVSKPSNYKMKAWGKRGWEYKVYKPCPSPSMRGEGNGGTHASPRWHLRRGHWRRKPNSQERIWIRSSEVGDKARGGIIKDYDLRA